MSGESESKPLRRRGGEGGEREAGGAHARAQYAPIAALIARRQWAGRVTELSINGPQDVWIRVAGEGYLQLPVSDVRFLTRAWFEHLCQFLAAFHGIQWRKEFPVLACRTPDGSRFQGLIGSNATKGIMGSLRVMRKLETKWEDFEVLPEQRALIEKTLADGKALFLSGGTGSGKTTFLRMLLDLVVPMHERLGLIQDVEEIQPKQPNMYSILVSRSRGSTLVGWSEAFDICMRQNPDRIIPGELAIASAFPTLQVFDSGHSGAMTTMHSNSPLDAMRGFRRRVALGGGNVGTEVADMFEFFAENVGAIVQIKHKQTADNTERRVVTDVANPRDLIGGKTTRDDIREQEQAADRSHDLKALTEVLTAALSGRTPDPAAVHRARASDDDEKLLSPEDLCLLEVGKRTASLHNFNRDAFRKPSWGYHDKEAE